MYDEVIDQNIIGLNVDNIFYSAIGGVAHPIQNKIFTMNRIYMLQYKPFKLSYSDYSYILIDKEDRLTHTQNSNTKTQIPPNLNYYDTMMHSLGIITSNEPTALKESYSNIPKGLFIEGAPDILESYILIYDYNNECIKSIIKNENNFGGFSILTPAHEVLKVITAEYKGQKYKIDYSKPMKRGHVTIVINTSVCVDSDFIIKCFNEDNMHLGDYEINMSTGECIIPNLDCNKTYSVMLYDRNKVIESRMMSHRTPEPYYE